MQLQRNVDEEEGKYTEAMAEVYLPPSESTLLRSQWLRHRVQLQRNVDEEGGKYTEAMAEVCLPSSESILLRSQWLRHRVNIAAKSAKSTSPHSRTYD